MDVIDKRKTMDEQKVDSVQPQPVCAEESEEEEVLQEVDYLVEKMEPPSRRALIELLSDVGTFSFCSLCASLLNQLYSQNYREFCLTYIRNLVKHLDLPENVMGTMEAFLDSDAPDSLATLVPVILDEQQDTGAILQELVYFSIKDGAYDARSRVLVHSVASFLRVSEGLIEKYEAGALHCLTSQISNVTEEQKKASEKAARKKKIRRRVIIAAASVGGGVLIGLTGGLAVPLLATGAAAIIGGAGAAVIGSIAGTAVIGSLFGLAGAGLTGMKMKKRVGQVEEFAFEELTEGKELNLAIAISGWLTDDSPSAFRQPWENLFISREQYCLRYESKYLRNLGTALDQLATVALTMVTAEALKTTALAAFLAPLAAPAAIIQLTSIIDNPWCVCVKRSAEVGSMLAHALLSREQGMRPITLIGYSFGARVIFYCLKEMLKQKPESREGIIENVILLGAPVPAAENEWIGMDNIVAGKIINAYSCGDWMLKIMFRTAEATANIAGLQPIAWKSSRVTNIDVSDIVSGHLDYRNKISEILKVVGIRCRSNTWKQSFMIKKAKDKLPNPAE